jgi:hypothetical protein
MLHDSLETLKYTGKNKEVSLMIVAKKEDFEKYTSVDKRSVKFIEVKEGESTSFQHLVNLGVKKCNTEYFTILEIDDKFTENAFVNAENYLNSEYQAPIMLFLTEAVNYETRENGSIGYLNEAAWANGFSEIIGTIDADSISDFYTFNLTGAIIKKDDFLSVGGLKESMKMTFWYEFALRALKYGLKMFVIPKVGYLHMINRPDSLSDIYAKSMKEEEAAWWIDLAKKEYFYKEDRNKVYE